MKTPREFFIDELDRGEIKGPVRKRISEAERYIAYEQEIEYKNRFSNNAYIHVIEFKAYEELQAKYERAVRALRYAYEDYTDKYYENVLKELGEMVSE